MINANPVASSFPFELPNADFFQNNMGYVSIFVLLLLLFIIFWYAYKTNKLLEMKDYVIKTTSGVSKWFSREPSASKSVSFDNDDEGGDEYDDDNDDDDDEIAE